MEFDFLSLSSLSMFLKLSLGIALYTACAVTLLRRPQLLAPLHARFKPQWQIAQEAHVKKTKLTNNKQSDANGSATPIGSIATRNNNNNAALRLVPPFLSAHRGGSVERPENSIAAFDNAIEQQCEFLELDVRLTRDRQVVVTHDAETERVADTNVLIAHTHYKDLPRMKHDLPFVPLFTAGLEETHLQWRLSEEESKQESKLDTAYRMPLLRDVLQRYPDAFISCDLKDNSEDLMHEVSNLIDELEDESLDHRLIWGSATALSAKMSQLKPAQPSFFSAKDVLRVYLLYCSGLLPWFPLRKSHWMMPVMTQSFLNTVKARSGNRWWSNQLLHAAQWLLYRKTLIAHLQARGVATVAWVLNTETEFDAALQLGVDSIMSDQPTLLKQWAIKRGLQHRIESTRYKAHIESIDSNQDSNSSENQSMNKHASAAVQRRNAQTPTMTNGSQSGTPRDVNQDNSGVK